MFSCQPGQGLVGDIYIKLRIKLLVDPDYVAAALPKKITYGWKMLLVFGDFDALLPAPASDYPANGIT